jgi:hypothetical protein
MAMNSALHAGGRWRRPRAAASGLAPLLVREVTVTVGGVDTGELYGGCRLAARADDESTGPSYGSDSAANTDDLNRAYGSTNVSPALSRNRFEVDLYAKNAFNSRSSFSRTSTP